MVSRGTPNPLKLGLRSRITADRRQQILVGLLQSRWYFRVREGHGLVLTLSDDVVDKLLQGCGSARVLALFRHKQVGQTGDRVSVLRRGGRVDNRQAGARGSGMPSRTTAKLRSFDCKTWRLLQRGFGIEYDVAESMLEY